MAPNLLTNYFGRHNVKKIVIFSNQTVSDHSLVALLNAFFLKARSVSFLLKRTLRRIDPSTTQEITGMVTELCLVKSSINQALPIALIRDL